MNCYQIFKSGKTARRTALNTNIQHHDVSPKDVIDKVYVKPGRMRALSQNGRFVCQACTSCLGIIATGLKKMKEASDVFIHRCDENSYLKSKLTDLEEACDATLSFTLSPTATSRCDIKLNARKALGNVSTVLCCAYVTPVYKSHWVYVTVYRQYILRNCG